MMGPTPRNQEATHLRRLWGSIADEVPTDADVRRTIADGVGDNPAPPESDDLLIRPTATAVSTPSASEGSRMSDASSGIKYGRVQDARQSKDYERSTRLRMTGVVGSNLLAQDSPTTETTFVPGHSRQMGLSVSQQRLLWAAPHSAVVFGRRATNPQRNEY